MNDAEPQPMWTLADALRAALTGLGPDGPPTGPSSTGAPPSRAPLPDLAAVRAQARRLPFSCLGMIEWAVTPQGDHAAPQADVLVGARAGTPVWRAWRRSGAGLAGVSGGVSPFRIAPDACSSDVSPPCPEVWLEQDRDQLVGVASGGVFWAVPERGVEALVASIEQWAVGSGALAVAGGAVTRLAAEVATELAAAGEEAAGEEAAGEDAAGEDAAGDDVGAGCAPGAAAAPAGDTDAARDGGVARGTAPAGDTNVVAAGVPAWLGVFVGRGAVDRLRVNLPRGAAAAIASLPRIAAADRAWASALLAALPAGTRAAWCWDETEHGPTRLTVELSPEGADRGAAADPDAAVSLWSPLLDALAEHTGEGSIGSVRAVIEAWTVRRRWSAVVEDLLVGDVVGDDGVGEGAPVDVVAVETAAVNTAVADTAVTGTAVTDTAVTDTAVTGTSVTGTAGAAGELADGLAAMALVDLAELPALDRRLSHLKVERGPGGGWVVKVYAMWSLPGAGLWRSATASPEGPLGRVAFALREPAGDEPADHQATGNQVVGDQVSARGVVPGPRAQAAAAACWGAGGLAPGVALRQALALHETCWRA